MTYAPGEAVRIDFPGHSWHGKVVRVVKDVADFELMPDGSDPSLTSRVIFCDGPGAAQPIGLGLERIAGTIEAQSLRRWEADESDDRQGDLAL